jgi:autotransporter passenger strand-loop-strand repeat protein
MTTIVISSGQAVCGTILGNGNLEGVLSGGIANAAMIGGGGGEFIYSGGSAEECISHCPS